MDRIDELLKWVQKSNPTMTKSKLLEELGKNRYSAVGLVIAWQGGEKSGSSYRS